LAYIASGFPHYSFRFFLSAWARSGSTAKQS